MTGAAAGAYASLTAFARTLLDDPDAATALATLGLDGPLGDRNLLINPECLVNQRGFAGGALAAGVYGYDCWKGGTGGCSLSVANGVFTLNGPIAQVLEAPGLAGETLTFSAKDPGAAITVTAAASGSGSGSASTTIPAGSGRRAGTLTVPSTANGNVALTFATGAQSTFSRPLVEIGSAAGVFVRRKPDREMALCERYYELVGFAFSFYASNLVANWQTINYRQRKATSPVITLVTTGSNTNVSGLSLTPSIGNPTGSFRGDVTPSNSGQRTWVSDFVYAIASEL